MPQNILEQADFSDKSLGKSILAAFTQQELTLILNALLPNLPPSYLETTFNQLPISTRETLQQLITLSKTPTVTIERPTTSLSLQEQTWSKLWGQWNDIIFEATEEDSKYTEQEESWEPPYFQDEDFIDDLEVLAAEMLPLLPTAYEDNFHPEVDFKQVFEEMAEEVINGMPEEIQLVNERLYLKSSLTTCLLQWEWLKAKEIGLNAFDFLQIIREWEEKVEQIELEPNTFLNFCNQLSETELQQIYQGLTHYREAPLWKTYLDNIRSHWHKLYLDCLQKYNPEYSFKLLRQTIPQQWQNGLPVIENLIAKEAYQEGLVVVEETLRSLLSSNHHQEISWSPYASLLVTLVGRSYLGDSSDLKIKLLQYYQQIGQALHQLELVNALSIQLTAFEHCYDWSVMLEAFKQAEVSQSIRQNLYQSWSNYIIKSTEGKFWGWRDSRNNTSWWLFWLLDSLLEERIDIFSQQIEQWLVELNSNENPSRQDFSALQLLTIDLAAIRDENWKLYPNFQEVVLKPEGLKTFDANSRQSIEKQFMPQDLWHKVIDYWQHHLDYWIPQPETARKSDYTEHAQWLAALRELSRDKYQYLLAQWRIKHKSRRNLWKALAQIGLE